jgi:hypothetical protein
MPHKLRDKFSAHIGEHANSSKYSSSETAMKNNSPAQMKRRGGSERKSPISVALGNQFDIMSFPVDTSPCQIARRYAGASRATTGEDLAPPLLFRKASAADLPLDTANHLKSRGVQ